MHNQWSWIPGGATSIHWMYLNKTEIIYQRLYINITLNSLIPTNLADWMRNACNVAFRLAYLNLPDMMVASLAGGRGVRADHPLCDVEAAEWVRWRRPSSMWQRRRRWLMCVANLGTYSMRQRHHPLVDLAAERKRPCATSRRWMWRRNGWGCAVRPRCGGGVVGC
jgi:hypothetical protein